MNKQITKINKQIISKRNNKSKCTYCIRENPTYRCKYILLFIAFKIMYVVDI